MNKFKNIDIEKHLYRYMYNMFSNDAPWDKYNIMCCIVTIIAGWCVTVPLSIAVF